LLKGFGFAPTSFIRLGLFREGDFAVPTNSAVPTDFLANATPPIPGPAGVALADAQQKRRVRFFMTSTMGACLLSDAGWWP
jgi:hypothetical protein